MQKQWNIKKGTNMSFGSDGLTGSDGHKVHIVTDSQLDEVLFLNCVDEGFKSFTADNTEMMWRAEMEKNLREGEKLDERYASICADNTAVNPAAGKIFEEKHPGFFSRGAEVIVLTFFRKTSQKSLDLETSC